MPVSTAIDGSISPDEFRNLASRIETQVGRVIVGQDEAVRGMLIALIAGGHVLLEGVPGLGKTSLVRTFAQTLDLGYARIQFTPDLMPADITGTNMLLEDENGRRSLSFQKGPLFANLVLADEINRATPKTQSALLEAMQEQIVTASGISHPLPRPFFVLATQNPVEMEGTYPLPEAQLDRFLLKLVVSYPSLDELSAIVTRTRSLETMHLDHAATANNLLEMNRLARDVPIASHVLNYIARLVMATQPDQRGAPEITHTYVRLGASPRAAQALSAAGAIAALLDGRYSLAFADVRAVAHMAMRHRIVLNFEAQTRGITTDTIIDHLLEEVPESLR